MSQVLCICVLVCVSLALFPQVSLAISYDDGAGPAPDTQELCEGVGAMWRGTVAFYIDPSWNSIKQRMQDSVLQIIDLCSAFVRVEQVCVCV